MKRTLYVLLASTAIGALAHARPASACGAQQKTTTTKAEEKVQPQQKGSSAAPQEEQQRGARTAKAATASPRPDPGAQARNEPAAARAQQR
jgi:hypothetical protein